MTYSETQCSICGWEVEGERAVFYFGAVAADTRDRLRTHYLWHMAVAAQPPRVMVVEQPIVVEEDRSVAP